MDLNLEAGIGAGAPPLYPIAAHWLLSVSMRLRNARKNKLNCPLIGAHVRCDLLSERVSLSNTSFSQVAHGRQLAITVSN
jgi:hypothetical protein